MDRLKGKVAVVTGGTQGIGQGIVLRLEAMTEGMIPGEGDLPLLDYLRATPSGTTIGVEVSQLFRAQRGETPRQFIGAVVAAARALAAAADAAGPSSEQS